MAKSIDKLAQDIRDLTDVEKLRLIDVILTDLDKPGPGNRPGVGGGGAQTVGGLQSQQDPNRQL